MDVLELVAQVRAGASELGDPDGYYTVAEYASVLSVGADAVRRRLHALDAAGLLQVEEKTIKILGGPYRRTKGFRARPTPT